MRKRKQKALPRRGYFIDVKTLAAALLSQSFTLESLADHLGTAHRKEKAGNHGAELTNAYIGYAVRDVQMTWECYCALRDKFARYDFEQTLEHQILSEAGIGKALLKEIGIRPWREVQPDFHDWLTGIIMSTYYGGRSEVHWRRIMAQVAYCDFLSMYPSVCTLMGLWQFVIANGIEWRDSTDEISKFLNEVILEDLQRPETWRKLTAIVQVQPSDDLFPVRADYDGRGQETIGLNYLKSKKPLWFTLADCIVSKLLTGKAPKVIRAISLEPRGIQDSLNSITIAGNPEYQIDPYRDDLFKRIIDLRLATKQRLKKAKVSEKATLENEQLALKITANSISYGIFVELNVVDLGKPQERECYGHSGKPFSIATNKIEEPGRYFHPLLATLITGAARLMLAISETLARKNGLDWAFCDTDSIAFVKTDGIDATFNSRVEIIQKWFDQLNPYSTDVPLLKLEIANYRIENGEIAGELTPLYYFGISSKRYALFNLDPDGIILIRKASAHGLGHLIAPYQDADAPSTIPAPEIPLKEIGVERWQYDLWHKIIRAVLDGHPAKVVLDYHQVLNCPAASRYGATTPNLLNWFKTYNRNRLYRDQVRPFNFLHAFQAWQPKIQNIGQLNFDEEISPWKFEAPKPIAPYDSDTLRAAKNCFDRESGKSVPINLLKTYREVLAQHHLRPEAKFLNGDYLDKGKTRRRWIEVIAIRNIGKEANRWEEQFYLGVDQDAQIDYGVAPGGRASLIRMFRKAAKNLGQRKLAERLGISRQTLAKLLRKRSAPIPTGIAGLIAREIASLIGEVRKREAQITALLRKARIEIKKIGLSEFARRLGVDPSNLAKVLNGERLPSESMLHAISFRVNSNLLMTAKPRVSDN